MINSNLTDCTGTLVHPGHTHLQIFLNAMSRPDCPAPAEAEQARLKPELDSQDETLHSEIFEGEYGPDEPGYPYNQSDYC